MVKGPIEQHLHDLLFILDDRERRGVSLLTRKDKTESMLSSWRSRASQLMDTYPYTTYQELESARAYSTIFGRYDEPVTDVSMLRRHLSRSPVQDAHRFIYFKVLMHECLLHLIVAQNTMDAREKRKAYVVRFDDTGTYSPRS